MLLLPLIVVAIIFSKKEVVGGGSRSQAQTDDVLIFLTMMVEGIITMEAFLHLPCGLGENMPYWVEGQMPSVSSSRSMDGKVYGFFRPFITSHGFSLLIECLGNLSLYVLVVVSGLPARCLISCNLFFTLFLAPYITLSQHLPLSFCGAR